MEDFNLFGNRLQRLREIHGYTRYKVCMALDVNVPDLKALEYGEYYPSSSRMERLACIIGVGILDLVGDTDAEAYYFTQRARREKPKALPAAFAANHPPPKTVYA